MQSYPIGARVFTSSPTNPRQGVPTIRLTEAPWIATPLDLREDPRIITFASEVIALGVTSSRWLAESVAIATYHRLHAWAIRHAPEGSLAGISPVALAGGVGWQGEPGALWASMIRSEIIDAFGAITGWKSTGGRRGARMSAMGLPSRMQVGSSAEVFGPSQRGRRLGLAPEDRKARRQWQNATASANRRQRIVSELPADCRQRTSSQPSANYQRTVSELQQSSLTRDLLETPSLEVEKERISLTRVRMREQAGSGPAEAMHPAWSHPAVVTWLETCKIGQPRNAQAIAIATGVREDAGSLAVWRAVCEYGVRNGHNVNAVDWMLDRYAPRQRQENRGAPPVRATVATTRPAPVAQAEPEPQRTIVPADRDGFRRAFAGTPFGRSIATETPGVQTAVVARAVPDLATMSRPDRAVAMAAMLARIGQPS